MLNITKKIITHLSDQLGLLSIIGSGTAGAGIATMLITGVEIPGGDLIATIIGLALIILDYFIVFPPEKEEEL